MAETAAVSNNKAVVFRGKTEREMPSVSQAQNRFMHAVAEGKVKGVKKSVGKDFVAADKGRKIGKLPKHSKAHKMHARGLISDKQLKKIAG